MILADKIIRLRKKNGWSQEEFAEKMDVSRQAVSKWESSQVIPSIEKILQMASLFGVTTDYLLKDEIENEEFTNDSSEECVKRITIEEANTYLNLRKRASWLIALATFLCILSPIPLIFLSAASEVPKFNVSETSMCMLGLCALLSDTFTTSNRESGDGRYDIQLKPNKKNLPGILIELKATKNCTPEQLKKLSEDALQQIINKKYDTELLSAGIETIYKYGVAFSGKNVEVTVG